MKYLAKITFLFVIVSIAVRGNAQDTAKMHALIREGVALNDSGKYNEAINKYKAALEIDPNSLRARYEMSYTLAASGRADEAVPILEKVAASDDYPEAFDLLGSIYDDKKDYDKAMAYYTQGIIAFPKFERLRFNMGISYLRQEKYAEAEQSAIEAIKLQPKHTSSHRLYALASYKQHKDAQAIMAFCVFLVLEPQSQRSQEAYRYVKQIFESKIKVDSAKGRTQSMTIYVQDNKGDTDEAALEIFLSMDAASPSLDTEKTKSPVDALNDELTDLFKEGGELAEKKKDKDFFWRFYAGYLYKLAQSGNMPAFTRVISLSGYRDDNLKWLNDNKDKLKALQDWAANNPLEPGN